MDQLDHLGGIEDAMIGNPSLVGLAETSLSLCIGGLAQHSMVRVPGPMLIPWGGAPGALIRNSRCML